MRSLASMIISRNSARNEVQLRFFFEITNSSKEKYLTEKSDQLIFYPEKRWDLIK